MPKHDFLLQDIKNLKGIGIKTANLLRKKKDSYYPRYTF